MSTSPPAITTNELFLGGVLLFLSIALSFASVYADSTPQGTNIAAKLPGYDVVSIKPNKSGSRSVSIDSHLDLYTATNVRFKTLLQNAYDIKENLISGVPKPLESARFDVTAKMVDPDLNALKKLSRKQWQSMLLPVLVERFQLKAHTEMKILPVYDLVVTGSRPKFKQLAADSTGGSGTSIHNNELTARNITMASLASTLSDQVHRTVIDKTSLTGRYDLALRWTPYDLALKSSPDDRSDAQSDSAPSIFTALQEQLGLKLKPAKGPVDTLVVDHVEMPSEN